jgi:hypothetical protein
MDTGVHAQVTDKRFDAILGKVDLLKRGSQSVAVQGGAAGWQYRPEERRVPESRPTQDPREAEAADRKRG